MQDFNNYNKRIQSIALITVLLTVYFSYSIGLFLRVGINSDYSNLVLEASDILSGNVFLSDWNLTGITFITTDLLYFIIGVAVAGTTVNAYYVAVILMYFTLLAGALFLLKTKGKRTNWIDVVIFLAVGGMPSIYACDILRAHTAVPAFTFFAIYFGIKAYYLIATTNKWQRNICFTMFTLLLTLCCAGDPIALIIAIVPIVLICLYNLTGNNIINKKLNIIFLSLSIASVILGKLIDTLFFMAGDANKNSFLEQKTFTDIDTIRDKFKIYLSSILGMFNASFFGEKLMTINTLWCFLRIIVVLFSFYIMFKSIYNFLKHRNTDMVSVVLSLGFLLMSLIFILTDIAVDINSARYIGYLPILSAVLIVRYFKYNDTLITRIANKKISKKSLIVVYSIVLILSNLAPVDFKKPVTSQDNLAKFLVENGLKNGYAKFWNASHVTLASEGKVNVRAVVYDNDKNIQKFTWFCKNSWYTPDSSNFVVIENSDSSNDGFGITKESVKKCIGKPGKVLSFENYTIYVYNVDIADRILK